MNNTEIFSGKGSIYSSSRPKYADALFTLMHNKLSNKHNITVADIGSGTGIFSSHLLDCGYTVYAVEPNRDMRENAEKKLVSRDGFISINGCDSNTTLASESVDIVTVAQAFHWFDREKFRAECKRILKPDGMLFIVYNSRPATVPVNSELSSVLKKYCKSFKGFSGGISDEACTSFFVGGCETHRWNNNLIYSRQAFIDRTLSSSYSLKESDENFSAYIADLNSVFDKYSTEEYITVRNDTVVYLGQANAL